MSARPYVGITGVVTPDDVATIASCVPLVPPSHRLMAGVLVSAKTLRDTPTTSRRYPPFARVKGLLSALADAGAWPVVHYNTRATKEMLLAELATLCGVLPSMAGLQLNVVAPDHDAVARIARGWPAVEVIVQVNRAVLGGDPVPADAVLYANGYAGARHALLDLSGGRGAAVDVSFAARVTQAWRLLGGVPRLGVAGGLGPDAGGALGTLREAIGDDWLASLSYDAETGVRSPVADPTSGEKHQDALDGDKARAWVSLAARAIRGEVLS